MADQFQQIGAVAVNVVAQVPIFRRYPGVARVLANRLARKAVEQQLKAEGVRVSCFPYAQLRQLAQAYLEAHLELLDRAAEIVRSDPKLRKMAEIEQRNRERQWRKMAKAGLLDIMATPDPNSQ